MNTELSPVARAAMNKLRAAMNDRGASLASDQWSALQSLIQTFDRITNGEADNVAYLSSLDPGVGKTTAISSYLAALEPVHRDRSDGRHPGALICVERIQQAHDFRDQLLAMGIHQSRIGIWVAGNKAFEKEKSDNLEYRPILLTTHERVRRMTKGRRMSDAWELDYRGQSRKLRVWDETFSVTRGIKIDKRSLGQAIGALSRKYEEEAADLLAQVRSDLDSWQDGGSMQFPHWVGSLGATDVDEYLSGERGTGLSAESFLDLAAISGKNVHVSKNGGEVAKVHFRPTLPDDIYPVVVTDASGRIRQQYADQERLGRVERLPCAYKTYENLTISVWRASGSKTAWKRPDNSEAYLSGIAELIESKPTEKWLVVHHKASRIGRRDGGVPDIPRKLRERLSRPENVAFLNWGRHTATNDFVGCENVILAGTLFYSDNDYEAMKRASAELQPDRKVLTADRSKVRLGELGHHILQALCRASARLPDRGDCRPCNAWIMALPKTGIEKALPTWFPGANIRLWKPSSVQEKPKTITNADQFVSMLEALSPGHRLTFAEARTTLGLSGQNFGRLLRNVQVRTAVEFLDIETLKEGRTKAFVK
ncbi:MAG: hypothetical protein RIM72_00385 [Alphaproteobacteria bacterium]